MKKGLFGKIFVGALAFLAAGTINANAEVSFTYDQNITTNVITSSTNTTVGRMTLNCEAGKFYKLQFAFNSDNFQLYDSNVADENGVLQCGANGSLALFPTVPTTQVLNVMPDAYYQIKVVGVSSSSDGAFTDVTGVSARQNVHFVAEGGNNGIMTITADSLAAGSYNPESTTGSDRVFLKSVYSLNCTTEKRASVSYYLDGSTAPFNTPESVHCDNSNTLESVYIPKDLVINTPEHTLKIVAKLTNDGGEVIETKEADVQFLVYTDQQFSDANSNNILQFLGYSFPVGSTLTTVKVTDSSILSKMGVIEAYQVKVSANGKPLSYYDKYKDKIGSFYAMPNYIRYNLPSGLDIGTSMKAFVFNSSFTDYVTELDAGKEEDCDGIYEGDSLVDFVHDGYIGFGTGKYLYSDNFGDEVVSIPNTAANMKLIIFVISGLLISAGGFILSKNLKKNN